MTSLGQVERVEVIRRETPVQVRPAPKPTTGYIREMKHLDTDHDLRLDAKELAAAQYTASMLLMLDWEECDRDGDGLISLPEFQVAAHDATEELRKDDAENLQQAQDIIARTVTLELLLNQLARDEVYAAEITALRQEIRDLRDEEAVVTYIFKYPARYPRLKPVIHTWGRYYPVRPRLHHVVKPRPIRVYRPPARITPVHHEKVRQHPPTPRKGIRKPKPEPHKGKRP
jgi:hypothetical protein